MWLLDAHVDIHLAALLTERGIACDTAANRTWKALSNGQLVESAVASGFNVCSPVTAYSVKRPLMLFAHSRPSPSC